MIITKDSDLLYSLSPKMDYFKIPTSKDKGGPQIRTYSEVYSEMPDEFKGKLGLYQYKAYCDAIGMGHNGDESNEKERYEG